MVLPAHVCKGVNVLASQEHTVSVFAQKIYPEKTQGRNSPMEEYLSMLTC